MAVERETLDLAAELEALERAEPASFLRLMHFCTADMMLSQTFPGSSVISLSESESATWRERWQKVMGGLMMASGRPELANECFQHLMPRNALWAMWVASRRLWTRLAWACFEHSAEVACAEILKEAKPFEGAILSRFWDWTQTQLRSDPGAGRN